MREIRFRAWDAYGKEMLSWEKLGELDEAKSLSLWNVLNGLAAYIQPLMFTGLHDKSGREIYEGDILRITPDLDVLSPEIVEVYFQDGGFIVEYDFTECDLLTIGWAIDHWDAGGDKYEVVGNIHENPELLPSPKLPGGRGA